jgi:phosphate transport system substrate-binding protein
VAGGVGRLRGTCSRLVVALAAAWLGVLVGACGQTEGVTLNGSGSSFQDTLQQTAIGAFEQTGSDVTVNYTKSGSSAGKKDLAAGNVAFAGSDSTIRPEEAGSFEGDILYFPLAAAPITVSFDLPGIDRVDLTAELVARMFQGEVATWDDPRIVALNPEVELPPIRVVPVVRSDGSGTTNNFTSYLEKAAPEVWRLGAGDVVDWPTGALAAEKNSGVAALLSSTPGGIGYVDLADAAAARLTRARLRNRAGRMVEAKLPGATAALESVELAADLTFSPLDTEGAEAYPITAPTWVLVEAEQPDEATRDALVEYLRFLLTDAQPLAPSVGFAPLPVELRDRAIAQLDEITARAPAP